MTNPRATHAKELGADKAASDMMTHDNELLARAHMQAEQDAYTRKPWRRSCLP